MRTARQVERFAAKVEGLGPDEAHKRMELYLSCVPRLFWETRARDVKHNRETFDSVIAPYTKRHRRARRNGYGLMLMGDNGSGKTMFMSYVLVQMLFRGYTVFYTTLPQLASDISRGFDDREFGWELDERLRSDFLAIDELGKEHDRSEFVQRRLELILKTRYDDRDPTLLGTNLNYGDFCKVYHASIKSMVDGKFEKRALEPGDFRRTTAARMRRDMGYDGV